MVLRGQVMQQFRMFGAGMLDASGGISAYLDQTTYDPFGQIQRTTYRKYGQQLVQTYTQDPGTQPGIPQGTATDSVADGSFQI